jgi:hypothetical protein
MLADKKNTGDAGYIAEEIMSDPELAMRSKCLSVYGTVTEKVFSLEKALKVYKVPYDTYITFVAKKQAEEMEDQGKSDSKKEEILFKINVFEKVFEYSFKSTDAKMVGRLISILSKFSKDVEDEKILVK